MPDPNKTIDLTTKRNIRNLNIVESISYINSLNLPEKLCIFCHQIKTRFGFRMSQQRLWCHQDKWLAER